MDNEIWIDIKDYEGLYQVSNYGRVKSLDHITEQINCGQKVNTLYKGKILKPDIDKGYHRFALCKNNVVKRFFAHQLVANAFIPNPDNKKFIDHLNGIRDDNRIENLKWCTYVENNNNPITLKKLSDVKKGQKNNIMQPVARCDEEWKIMEIYPSLKEARRQGYCNVRNAIYNSKSHLHRGWKWKFIE